MDQDVALYAPDEDTGGCVASGSAVKQIEGFIRVSGEVVEVDCFQVFALVGDAVANGTPAVARVEYGGAGYFRAKGEYRQIEGVV